MRAHRALLGLATLVVLVGAGCATPAGVVEAAAAAAADDDLDAYVACFTARSRPLLRAYYASAREHRPELARLGASDVAIAEVKEMSRALMGTPRVVVTAVEAGRSIPLVLHGVAGAWRIDLMDSERALSGLGMGL